MLLTIETKINVTEEDIENIIDMAGYGISYWCDKAVIKEDSYKVHDDEEDKWYTLSYEDILKGVGKYIENGNKPYDILDGNGGIDAGMIDAEVADMIIQYCCFGQIIYC